MKKVISIFGPPGTGKTTKLVELINNISKTTFNIVVLSYSRSSAKEIQSRLKNKSLFKVKTCHSLAFELNEYDSSQVLTTERVEEMRIKDIYFNQFSKKDFYEMYSTVCISEEKLEQNFEPYLKDFVKRFKHYKKVNMLISFSDMLKDTKPANGYDYVIVDEAQDMTPLNWEFIKKLPKFDGTVYLAGDDDQNIYNFNGSNEQIMIDEADEKIILKQSYRMPKTVHELSQNHVKTIFNRQDKVFSPTDKVGEVDRISYVDVLTIDEPVTVLFRDNFKMKEFEKELLRMYIPYTKSKAISYFDSYFAEAVRAWSRKDIDHLAKNSKYFNEQIESPEHALTFKDWRDVFEAPFTKVEFLEYIYNVDLLSNCNINLSTIHNFKGLESDWIILFADLPNRASLEYYTMSVKDVDSEKRVWYVGLTRARNKLTIVGDNKFLELD